MLPSRTDEDNGDDDVDNDEDYMMMIKHAGCRDACKTMQVL